MLYYDKVIETTVNAPAVISFAADKDRRLLLELQNLYAGRCFKGAYILQVKAVRKASDCLVITTNASGGGYVDVQFLAEVAVFSKWNILVGVEVALHQPNLVGVYEAPPPPGAGPDAKGARAVVTLAPTKGAEALAVGQRVAVRVVSAVHPPMQTQAAVYGVLLTCDQTAPTYRLGPAAALGPGARVELAPLLRAVDAELERRAALVAARRDDLWFFERHLYAYLAPGAAPPDQRAPTGAADWEGPGGRPLEAGAAQNVLLLARRAAGGEEVPVPGLWARPLALYRSSPFAAQADALPPGWAPPADAVPHQVFAEFLKTILNFLAAVNAMAELYATTERRDAARAVWAAMRAAQRPA